MRETALPIGEVGSTVGYADPLQLSRGFRWVFAMAPRDYRNRDRQLGGNVPRLRRPRPRKRGSKLSRP